MVDEKKPKEQPIRALEEVHQLHSLVLERMAEGVMVVKERTIIFANASLHTMFGYAQGELLGQHTRVLNATTEEENKQRSKQIREQINKNGAWRGEIQSIRKDGTEFTTFSHVSDAKINNERFVIVLRQDITGRKRMEEEIRKAHTLESLGLLAGGIAHDFNNVLTGVIGNIALLERLLDKNSTEYEIAIEAKTAADRTKGLTSQLLTFAQGGGPVKETASIEDLIRETVDISLRGANTRPEYHLADDLWSVDIDVGQIGQVIQNLVINADHAMPEGGILRLSAENVELSDNAPLPLEAGPYVKVSVEDQGIGIPEDFLEKIFDPYFTTKDAGHGLGLSITYSIVQRHGGYITVDSVPYEGSTFAFYLPAPEKPDVAVAKYERELTRGTGKILLMDDEEIIHRTVGRGLTMLGYSVESAYDGAETLHAYRDSEEAGSPYDAVIMDLTIPGGMGGRDAVEKLHDIYPEARVIVSSGYASDPIMERPAEYGFAGKINKPVNLAELADMVQNVLAD